MDDVALVADRVVVMNAGRVALDGTVDEVYSQGEILAEMGLDVPEITALFLHMKREGLLTGKTEYTVSGARDAIIKALSKGGVTL
jgi:energy-coupling factor transport system ATP-binding protein